MRINSFSDTELNARIEKMREEIALLEKEREELLTKLPDEVMETAEVLHANLCHSNHTDGCDWYYGSWSKPSSAHRDYTNKAKDVIAFLDEYRVRNPIYFLRDLFKIIH